MQTKESFLYKAKHSLRALAGSRRTHPAPIRESVCRDRKHRFGYHSNDDFVVCNQQCLHRQHRQNVSNSPMCERSLSEYTVSHLSDSRALLSLAMHVQILQCCFIINKTSVNLIEVNGSSVRLNYVVAPPQAKWALGWAAFALRLVSRARELGCKTKISLQRSLLFLAVFLSAQGR
jgi:hypothetical protein